jgi:hypothetical protein
MENQKEITEKQNIENIKQCPRFETCSIPKCPLDFFMSERVELPEDERCPLRGIRTKRTKGIKSTTLKSLSRFIWKKNKSSDKKR